MLVSVICRAYQCAPYIHQMVTSIKRQTFRDWELIVIDDGSVDHTADVARDAARNDPRIKVFSLESNVGCAAAFRPGYERAHGEIIMRQDADDWSAPTRMAKQLELIDEGYDIVSCGMIWVDGGRHRLVEVTGMDPVAYIQLPSPRGPGGPTLMAARCVYERVGLPDPAYNASEDSDWNLRALALDNPPLTWGHTKAPLYFYRRHPDQMTQRMHIDGDKVHTERRLYYKPIIERRLQMEASAKASSRGLVVIEAVKRRPGVDQCIKTLDALADACKHLGYRVERWKRNPKLPADCDVLIRFGSDMTSEQKSWVLNHPRHPKDILFEFGWTLDRATCLQLDSFGCGGLVDWADEPFMYTPNTPLTVKRKGDLLVCLRYERDNRPTDRVELLSPFFPANLDLVRHLAESVEMPVRLRPHPDTSAFKNEPLQRIAASQNWAWSVGGTFTDACKPATAVAVIDSTAGAQAMEMGLPVLCYGRTVYRFPGACYCMTNDEALTKSVTNELANGVCSVDRAAVRAMIARIRSHQWYVDDAASWPEKLRLKFGM